MWLAGRRPGEEIGPKGFSQGGLFSMIRALSYAAAAVAALTAAGALAGCAAAGETASAATGGLEQRVITVDSVPAAEEGGLYVAQAQGYFAQEGLTVNIKPVTGGEAGIPDLKSGRAQLVGGNYVSFILAQMAGTANLRIVAAGSQIEPGAEALYVMPHSRFQTVADLAKVDAKIGLNTKHDVGDVMVGALLTQAGYGPGDYKQVIPPGGFPALLKMLPAGQVDAAWLPQPLGEQAEQQIGAVPIADFDQGALQNYPFTGYIGGSQWVQSHPKTVAAFLRALIKGQQLADTDRSAVEQALEKEVNVPPIIAATMSLDSYPLEMDVPQLQRVANTMFEFGLTSTAYDIRQMIQPEPGLIAK
jgi:NitT/TauT family transport system substrate-binding protein